jgi:hypothetical protein
MRVYLNTVCGCRREIQQAGPPAERVYIDLMQEITTPYRRDTLYGPLVYYRREFKLQDQGHGWAEYTEVLSNVGTRSL